MGRGQHRRRRKSPKEGNQQSQNINRISLEVKHKRSEK